MKSALLRWSCPCAALTTALISMAAPAAPANDWPTHVSASYKVTFAGVEIGKFSFESIINGQGYTLAGNAELSALFGMFSWKGATRSSGNVAGEAPKPAAYTFDYKSNSKHGSVKMSFNTAGVSQVSVVPPSTPSDKHVPVREEHLKSVLDPLSAVMALTRNKGAASPCARTISIFDGKQRFDLQFAFRRQQRIAETSPSGQPGFAYVCRVKYMPIAGHKTSDENKQLSDNANIEVALRPVPSANLLIPYQVTIPTIAGSAVMTAHRVQIVTPGRGQIALTH